MKPTLKPPGAKHLKLTCVEVLSSIAFNFNLRHYNLAEYEHSPLRRGETESQENDLDYETD
jgi:hypothetical protein